MSKKILIGGGVVAAALLLLLILNRSEKLPTNQFDNSQTDENDVQTIELVVAPQLVGTNATIAKVQLREPGYVVVQEVFASKLGQILEVSDYLEAGVSNDIDIPLFDVPNDAADVIAVLYKDNGDKGFSPNFDDIVTLGGVPVARSFTTGSSVPADVFMSNTDLSKIPEENIAYVSYTDEGYIPTVTDITLGDTVVFLNESSKDMWVASDPHPAHTILPTFDQFGFGKPGEQYQYTFDQAGVWEYHDHINPSAIGTIRVVESKNSQEVGEAILPSLNKNAAGYYQTSPNDFAQLINDPNVTTINVHIPYGGEIAGTEAFIPYNDTDALLAALPKDTAAPIGLYCRSGGMSAVAAEAVVKAGYTNVYDLTGGMNAYRDSGREVLNQPRNN